MLHSTSRFWGCVFFYEILIGARPFLSALILVSETVLW